MKRIAIILAITIFGVLGVSAQTKMIGMKKAKQIALQQVKGKIKSSELEKENGKLIYSFDIRNSKGVITEVHIDAYTGEVIETKVESADEERREKEEDAKKKP